MFGTVVIDYSAPLHALCMLIGKRGKHWLPQLPVYDEYTDPDYCHQN
ncbi:hypothetical protein ES703_09069 [subsurface metagenome]